MRGAKFVVIVLIMHIGVAMSCCVNPRRYACSAGQECASNPRHCTTCHKNPANARVKRAALNQTEINQRESDYNIQINNTLTPNDFARADKKIIDNEISNDIVTQMDSQTPSVTLIFLNASYTIAEAKKRLAVEHSTVYETILLTQAQDAQAPEHLASTQPDIRRRFPKLSKTYQRGILDLLFPAARLITFKEYLEALKRFLSATF